MHTRHAGHFPAQFRCVYCIFGARFAQASRSSHALAPGLRSHARSHGRHGRSQDNRDARGRCPRDVSDDAARSRHSGGQRGEHGHRRSWRRDSATDLHALSRRRRTAADRHDVPRRRLGDRRSGYGGQPKPGTLRRRGLHRRFSRLPAGSRAPVSSGCRGFLRGNALGKRERNRTRRRSRAHRRGRGQRRRQSRCGGRIDGAGCGRSCHRSTGARVPGDRWRAFRYRLLSRLRRRLHAHGRGDALVLGSICRSRRAFGSARFAAFCRRPYPDCRQRSS